MHTSYRVEGLGLVSVLIDNNPHTTKTIQKVLSKNISYYKSRLYIQKDLNHNCIIKKIILSI